MSLCVYEQYTNFWNWRGLKGGISYYYELRTTEKTSYKDLQSLFIDFPTERIGTYVGDDKWHGRLLGQVGLV